MIYNLWVIGDHFVKNIFGEMEEYKFKADQREKEDMPLFMTDFFNVLTFEVKEQGGVEFAMVRMVNNLIEAMVSRKRIPKYLLVIPDQDILMSDVDVFDDDAPIMVEEAANWLVRKFDVALRRRKLSFLERKPGALTGLTPTIIFVRMLRRVGKFSKESRRFAIHSLRSKFNDSLNDAVAKRGHRIMTVNSCNAYEHYDHRGNLTPVGRKEFWLEVDMLVNRFDLGKIKLLPNPKNPPRNHRQRDSHHDHARRLPSPPPRSSRNNYY